MRNMVLQWPTGLGKSKAAIDIINCIEALTPVRYKVLLVVAEIAHKIIGLRNSTSLILWYQIQWLLRLMPL